MESFNTKISEEAASAASNPNDLGSSKQESEGMVVRHGAGFRVVRAAGSVDPQADVVAASGQVTEQQERQPVALLSKTFAGSWQVRFLRASQQQQCKKTPWTWEFHQAH